MSDEELIFDKVVLINNDPYSVTEGLGMDLPPHVRKTPYFEVCFLTLQGTLGTLKGTFGTLIKLLRSSPTNMKNIQINKNVYWLFEKLGPKTRNGVG
jgi:hypothetical protein